VLEFYKIEQSVPGGDQAGGRRSICPSQDQLERRTLSGGGVIVLADCRRTPVAYAHEVRLQSLKTSAWAVATTLTKAPSDIVLGLFIARGCEQNFAQAFFDELALQEKSRMVGYARRLLDIMRRDDNRIVCLESLQ
jgi:hypothetical protein